MTAPTGYRQLPSGFWVREDGSGPYFVDVEEGAATAVGTGGGGAITTTANDLEAGAAAGTLTPGFYIDENGVMYIATGASTYVSLASVVGTGFSPLIGGSPLKAVVLDEGSDAAHAKLLYTFNCYGGDPDTSDVDLMSARFNAAASNEEVIDLNITGGSAGSIVVHGPSIGYITMIHLAREDSGAYTEAAGATITARQAVLAHWPESQLIRSVMLYIGESYVGAGSNQRYREIVVVGFTAS